MIRVNLISVTPGQAPPREWLPKEQRSAALGLALLLITAVGITSWWMYLRHERSNIEHSIVLAETELVRLKEVAQTVARATQRKAELAERLDLIERLRATMRAPMRLLETVSHSVPKGLWLIEIKQTGQTVQMDGRAMSLTPVTDFAKQMQESGFFQMPVEIVSTNAEVLEEVPVIRFVMKAELVAGGIAAVKAKPVATEAPAPVPTPVAATVPTAIETAGTPAAVKPVAAPAAAAPVAAPAPARTAATPTVHRDGIGAARTSGGR